MITETFIHGSGPVYSLDPRPKFIMLVCFVVLFLAESTLAVQGAMLIFILFWVGLSLGPRRVLTPVKSILPILVLTALLTPPFNTDGAVLLEIGQRRILTDRGLLLTAALIIRFTGITAGFYLFFSTTETGPFILALRAFGLPYRAALTVTISLRYIPDMFSTYGRISDAHKLRRAGFEEREAGRRHGFRHRLNNMFPVLVSVLIHAVKSIPALAMALDSKGLGRSNPRTSCRKLRPWKSIILQLIAATLIMGLATAVSVLL